MARGSATDPHPVLLIPAAPSEHTRRLMFSSAVINTTLIESSCVCTQAVFHVFLAAGIIQKGLRKTSPGCCPAPKSHPSNGGDRGGWRDNRFPRMRRPFWSRSRNGPTTQIVAARLQDSTVRCHCQLATKNWLPSLAAAPHRTPTGRTT